jgi:hypothetical protein
MDLTSSGRRGVSSVQLLLAAAASLVVMFIGARAYPYLVSFGVNGALLSVVRVATLVCLLAVVVLPIAAIIRRLTR